MRKLILLLLIFCSVKSFAQQSDTAFFIGGNSCNCIIIEDKDERERSMVFDKTQQPPSFPGGNIAWDEFVKSNLNTRFTGEKEEFSIVFIIQAQGDITDIKGKSPISDNKFQEAKRILLLSGKWCPGVVKGRCRRTYHKISFNF